MRVIGIAADAHYRPNYIAEVSHEEIARCLGRYYTKPEFQTLKVGESIDLALAPQIASEIANACRKMTEAMAAFESARTTLANFALMVAKANEAPHEGAAEAKP